MALQDIVEQTVSGLGYELVELERSAGGLLRITIDLPWAGPLPATGSKLAVAPAEQFINVEDCEKVTRQLVFVLEVEAIDYKRLEVSSPGIDRPLRTENDFLRFSGQVIDINLRAPMGEAAQGQVRANRKKFRGTLERVEQVAHDAVSAVNFAMQTAPHTTWQIVWSDEPPGKPGQRVSKKRIPAPLQALSFTLDELRDARLAPLVSFKGRGAAGALHDLNEGQAGQEVQQARDDREGYPGQAQSPESD